MVPGWSSGRLASQEPARRGISNADSPAMKECVLFHLRTCAVESWAFLLVMVCVLICQVFYELDRTPERLTKSAADRMRVLRPLGVFLAAAAFLWFIGLRGGPARENIARCRVQYAEQYRAACSSADSSSVLPARR